MVQLVRNKYEYWTYTDSVVVQNMWNMRIIYKNDWWRVHKLKESGILKKAKLYEPQNKWIMSFISPNGDGIENMAEKSNLQIIAWHKNVW